MQRARGGYTIVEVMLVLAVSSIILVSAVAAFSGKQTSTEFTQSVQDLASKIQSYASDVTSGSTPDFSTYDCSINAITGRPAFTHSIGGTPDNRACIFMGRALLVCNVSPCNNSILAYAVAGARNNVLVNGDPLAEFINQAHITTARVGGTPLFLDTYNLGNLRILSSSVNDTAGYGVIGLYSDLAGTSSPDTANSTGLLTRGYLSNASNFGQIRTCIEGTCTTFVDSPSFNKWTLCVQYAGGRRAQIISTATGSSLNSQINVNVTSC